MEHQGQQLHARMVTRGSWGKVIPERRKSQHEDPEASQGRLPLAPGKHIRAAGMEPWERRDKRKKARLTELLRVKLW